MIKFLTLIAVFALAVPQPFFAQDPAAAQKPPGPIVELSLIVTDETNKSVSKISKSEIRVIEGGVEQAILSVERDDRPISYAILIDASNSLRKLLGAAIEAAKVIIINRRVADEVFIEQFISSDKIETVHDFSTDTNSLLESLKQIRIEAGQSAIIDALYLGTEQVAQHKTGENRRKAIVILTDGEDRNSHHKFDALRGLLRKSGVQVFALGFVVELSDESGFVRRSSREKAEKLLNTVTKETGGRVHYPRTGPELMEAITEIITDLRSQFRVTYQSSIAEKKGSRKVDVKVTSSGGEKRRVVVHQVSPKDDLPKTKEQKSQ